MLLFTALRWRWQPTIYVLVAYWAIAVADVELQQPHGEAAKPGGVVQQTQDLTSLSKLFTK